MNQANKQLYEKIISNISMQVKRSLDENIQKFDVTDYEENDNDIINQDTIDSILNKRPKSLAQEEQFFLKTEPSKESKQIAKNFVTRIRNCLKPLMKIELSEECLDTNKYCFDLNVRFVIVSNYETQFIGESFEYTNIKFEYNTDRRCFILKANINKLAKMIEFCAKYKNKLDGSFFGIEDYFDEFQYYIQTSNVLIPDILIEMEFIHPNGGNVCSGDKFLNITDITFDKIALIYKEFAEFVPYYLKQNNF